MNAQHPPGQPPGLVYVSDDMPGISRRRRGRGFSYDLPDGSALRDPDERARIEALAVPPAYTDVWICPLPNGHVQATGIDDLGRKQYRYHPDWSAWRAVRKFDRLVPFGFALARLRARIRRDLEAEPGDLDFTLALLATLLDRAHLRVGNPGSARTSGTFGATTLLRRHVRLEEGALRLSYRGKGGRRVRRTLRDRGLMRELQKIEDLPGARLFTWLDAEGRPHPVGSHHINEYLAEATGVEGVTAKAFRTWAGTLVAFREAEREKERLTVKAMAEAAAEILANTPAVSRAAYIHPKVLDLVAMDAAERGAALSSIRPLGPVRLRAPERRLLGLLGG